MSDTLPTPIEQLNEAIGYLPDSPRKGLLKSLVTEFGTRLAEAPASSAVRYHHAYEGGLIVHLLEVYHDTRFLVTAVNQQGLTNESILTVALLHDIAKIGDASGKPYYVPNLSEKTGERSKAEPYKVSKDVRKPTTGSVEANTLLEFADFSDGEASLAFIKSQAPDLYSDLTESEINAIRYHDGGYGKAKYAAGYRGKEDALAILLHAADMLSSRKRNWETQK